MNVLYLAHTCPYPPNKGDRIRCFHILTHLSKNHDVTLIYPLFSREHLDCQNHLLPYCTSIFPVKINRFCSYLYCLMNMICKKPLSPAFFYSNALARLLKGLSYDVMLVDCSTMAHYALELPYPKIIDFVDIDSQKWGLFSEMSSFPMSLLYKFESIRLERYENFIQSRFDQCLVTSDYEKSHLKDSYNIATIRNGVDLHYFTAKRQIIDGTIIFMGAMNYFPNVDAVIFFHREIFPLIRKELPSAKFIVVGMNPTARVRALADEATLVTGFVADIRPYLSSASVCVVPLRLARGVQNKILEAMAMGVPVVATSAANRGINATPPQEILIADTPREFASATVRLLREASLREQVAAQAKRFVEQNFRWEKNLQQLDHLICHITRHSTNPSELTLYNEESRV